MSKMNSNIVSVSLKDFLLEAELSHYYLPLKDELKVQNVNQFKYVEEADLLQLGMTRPEIRRLKRYFSRYYPQSFFGKLKKKFFHTQDAAASSVSSSMERDENDDLEPGTSDTIPGRHIIQANSILVHKTLGAGEFGTVQQGVWTSNDGKRTQVAIKRLSEERIENNPIEFLKEASIMHAVNHPHIVRLYGVVLDTSAPMLVTELAPLRSLSECLKECSISSYITVSTLFDYACQICDGMKYLESKRLIHRDLAARNILVFSKTKVKISDFGLSRALGVGKDYYQSNFNLNLKLPIAWCAPECINFLKFTTASDVWAYGVTLWEMFSYGFQPWAAFTGQQILDAIDEPNHQRLEQPECCPSEVYQLMLKCWQHDPKSRPTFSHLRAWLSEVRPVQLQVVNSVTEGMNKTSSTGKEHMLIESGKKITVLDKEWELLKKEKEIFGHYWKGVTDDGKVGYFDPSNTVAVLSSSLPSSSAMHQNSNVASYKAFLKSGTKQLSRKGKLSVDMISVPQGDLIHTAHVGADGRIFGDLSSLQASKHSVPHQAVVPIKRENAELQKATTSNEEKTGRGNVELTDRIVQDEISADTAPLLPSTSSIAESEPRFSEDYDTGPSQLDCPFQNLDHEYHEIQDNSDGDDHNEQTRILQGSDINAMDSDTFRGQASGVTNLALSIEKTAQSENSSYPEKDFDFNTGSLVDEVFEALRHDHSAVYRNKQNEETDIRRNSSKKSAMVKPISSSERKVLDQAMAIASELASKSMHNLDSRSANDPVSPRTPSSPSGKKKFSFILGSKGLSEKRNFSQEAASIPDIQSGLTEEAKDAYNCLVQKPSLGVLTPSFENKEFHFPEKPNFTKKSEFFDSCSSVGNESPTRKSNNAEKKRIDATSSKKVLNVSCPCHIDLKKSHCSNCATTAKTYNGTDELDRNDGDINPLRLLRQSKSPATNALPLPPRHKSTNATLSTSSSTNLARHQRKHPLLLLPQTTQYMEQEDANKSLVEDSQTTESTSPPPRPPPKPARQSKNININQELNRLDNIPSLPEKNDRNFWHNRDSSFTDSAFNLNSDGRSQHRRFSSAPVQIYENSSVSLGGSENKELFDKRSDKAQNTKSNLGEQNHNRSSSMDAEGTDLFLNPKANRKKLEDFCLLSKMNTLQRVMGNTEEAECAWALEATHGDLSYAVKLIRLKSLCPSVMSMKEEDLISVMRSNHWDVVKVFSQLSNEQ